MSGGMMNGHEFYPGKASVWDRLLTKFEKLFDGDSSKTRKIQPAKARAIVQRAIKSGQVKLPSPKAPKSEKVQSHQKVQLQMCKLCSTPFNKGVSPKQVFCSKECASGAKRQRIEQQKSERQALAVSKILKCAVCSLEFSFDPKRSRKTTCSNDCSHVLYKRRLKGSK